MAFRQLAQCVRELGAAVAERQGALSAALEGSRCRKEEALSAQLSGKRSLLEHAGLMAYTQELLKETDAPCFVQAARITHNRQAHSWVWKTHLDGFRWSLCVRFLRRLAKAIESLQCFSLAADPSFRHFHSDASKEVKLIQGLGFIRGRTFY